MLLFDILGYFLLCFVFIFFYSVSECVFYQNNDKPLQPIIPSYYSSGSK